MIATPTPLFVFLVSASSLLMLAGCAARSANSGEMVGQADPSRATALVASVVQANVTLLPATLVPGAAALLKHQVQTLPEAGKAHPAKQAAAPSPTPLSPTPSPVKPAPAQTALLAKNSPNPAGQSKTDVPTRLIIPAIGLDAPVIAVGWSIVEQRGKQVSEWDVPNWRAAGWLNTSAHIGEPGNTVLEGHQDIDGRVFEDLEYLKQGDEIQVEAGSETHKYVVALRTIVPEKDQPLEVRHANARWIGSSNDVRLTLVTCWPRNDNTHRLILVALPAQ